MYWASHPAWPNVPCSRSAPVRLVNGSVARSTRRSRSPSRSRAPAAMVRTSPARMPPVTSSTASAPGAASAVRPGPDPSRDRDRHGQRGHGRVQRQHHRQDRIDHRGDVSSGERAGQQAERFTQRGGTDDVGGRVERQTAQAEHRRAEIARQRQANRRPQHVQQRGAIACAQARQPSGHGARGERDEGDERPGGRALAADRRHRQEQGNGQDRTQPGERTQRQAGGHRDDRPAVRMDEQRDRAGAGSQAEPDWQRRAGRAEHPRGTRAGGGSHGWEGAGTRTTMARRRRPATQSSTSDCRRSAARRARTSSRTSAKGRGRPSRR